MPLILGANSLTGGYEVDNSLRFNTASSDYLNRSAVTGDRRTFTISAWVKRSKLGSEQQIYSSRSSASNVLGLYFQGSNDTLLVTDYQSGGTMSFTTSAVYRDVSAWYHIVLAVDTTQATNTNRVKLYVNGEQVTFSASSYPTLDRDLYINVSGSNHYIGTEQSGRYFDGYMSDVYLIDGQQLTPTDFGEFDADSGVWKPIAYTGTYGTNGFFLEFQDSGALGTDTSGNTNDFTVNNLTSIDQTTDTPTNNFATLNPLLDVYNPVIFSNGNLTATGSGSGNGRYAFGSIPVANGKWYYEVKVTVSGSNPYVGILDSQSTLRRNSVYYVDSASGTNQSGYAVNMTGDIYHNNSNTYAPNIGSISTGNILGFAIDLDSVTRTLEIYKNGVSQTSFNIDAPNSGFYILAGISIYNLPSASADVNFGNPPFTITTGNADANGYGNFEYEVPAGYYALNTKNLAEFG
jgi:hypothetical protein